jgi:hypothetical protein
MNYDPLELIQEIKTLEAKRSAIDTKLQPLKIARQNNLVECNKLTVLLEAIQDICEHECRTEHIGGTHGSMRWTTCNACGYERY